MEESIRIDIPKHVFNYKMLKEITEKGKEKATPDNARELSESAIRLLRRMRSGKGNPIVEEFLTNEKDAGNLLSGFCRLAALSLVIGEENSLEQAVALATLFATHRELLHRFSLYLIMAVSALFLSEVGPEEQKDYPSETMKLGPKSPPN